MTSVYEPREDSELLASCVKEHAFGKVLDMGTGSGIQAFFALENKKVTSVLAVDINPMAVKEVERKIAMFKKEKITVVRSDLFSKVDGLFDTIICNPPYLPDEEQDKDPALYGGRQGYEWTLRFLTQAKTHLSSNGQILLLFSSLTNRDRVDLELKKLGYHHEQLVMLAQFFEQLFVYRIWRST